MRFYEAWKLTSIAGNTTALGIQPPYGKSCIIHYASLTPAEFDVSDRRYYAAFRKTGEAYAFASTLTPSKYDSNDTASVVTVGPLSSPVYTSNTEIGYESYSQRRGWYFRGDPAKPFIISDYAQYGLYIYQYTEPFLNTAIRIVYEELD